MCEPTEQRGVKITLDTYEMEGGTIRKKLVIMAPDNKAGWCFEFNERNLSLDKVADHLENLAAELRGE